MSRLITEPAGLTAADLHRSLSDPLLDTMNFLNEVTVRYPAAISFAPGRPHEEPFDAEHDRRPHRRLHRIPGR